MALVNCPECNKEVSDTAITCPHCGYNLSKPSFTLPSPKKKKISCFAAFFIILGTIVIMGLLVNQCDKSTTRKPIPDSAVMSSDPDGKALVQKMIDNGWVRFDNTIMVTWVSSSLWNQGDLTKKTSLAHALWLWQSSKLGESGVIAIHDADNDKTLAYYSASHGLEIK